MEFRSVKVPSYSVHTVYPIHYVSLRILLWYENLLKFRFKTEDFPWKSNSGNFHLLRIKKYGFKVIVYVTHKNESWLNNKNTRSLHIMFIIVKAENHYSYPEVSVRDSRTVQFGPISLESVVPPDSTTKWILVHNSKIFQKRKNFEIWEIQFWKSKKFYK